MNQASDREHQFPDRGPRRGLSYSLRGGPELVVRAMRVPYFSDLLFCFLFMVVNDLVLNNHYFSADSSRAEPLEKGKENSPHLLADHFFSPGPRMEIGKAFDSTSGKCFSLPLIVS